MLVTSDRFAVTHRVWFLLTATAAKMPASESGRYNSHFSEETFLTVAQARCAVKGGRTLLTMRTKKLLL